MAVKILALLILLVFHAFALGICFTISAWFGWLYLLIIYVLGYMSRAEIIETLMDEFEAW